LFGFEARIADIDEKEVLKRASSFASFSGFQSPAIAEQFENARVVQHQVLLQLSDKEVRPQPSEALPVLCGIEFVDLGGLSPERRLIQHSTNTNFAGPLDPSADIVAQRFGGEHGLVVI
jgi:hypothetical protein